MTPGMTRPPPAPRPVLLVSSDLLFRSRVDDVARRAGLELRVARTPEQFERHLANGLVPSLAVVDLECDTLDPAGAIARLRAMPWGPKLRIVGYAGHTNEPAIRAGRAAGASRVLARSAFVAQLPVLLARAAEDERGRGGAAGP
jgi:CheY-like chemotaxis protein